MPKHDLLKTAGGDATSADTKAPKAQLRASSERDSQLASETTADGDSGEANSQSSESPRGQHFAQGRGLLAAASAFACAVIVRIAAAPGWPQSHDISVALGETEIYAAHLRRWDLFPLWSTNDALGLGSPAPFYQPKVYSYVSALFRLVGCSPKAAVAASLLLFFWVGLLISYRVASHLVSDRRLCALLSVSYVFSTYVMSDVLVRADMNDFVWAMLLPWLVGLWLVLIQDRQLRWGIVPAFLILFFAQSDLTVAAGLLLVAAAVPSIIAGRFELAQRTFGRLCASAVLIAVLLTPYLLVRRQLGATFNPAVVTDTQPRASQGYFAQVLEFFTLPRWFGPPYLVNVSQLALIPVGILAVYLVWRMWRQLLTSTFVASLALLAIVPTFMQVRIAAPIYRLGAFKKLEFSWRLLPLATLGILLLAAGLLTEQRAPKGPRLPQRVVFAAFGTTALITLAISPVFARTQPDHVQYELGSYLDEAVETELASAGEYLPKSKEVADLPSSRLERLQVDLVGDYANEGLCKISILPWEFEDGHRDFVAQCSSDGIIVLPLYYSSLHSLTVDGNPVALASVPNDPRIYLAVPAGESSIRVNLP